MNKRRIRWNGTLSTVFVIGAAAVLLVIPISGASAHEHREVGNVSMAAGWGNEPAYAGFRQPPEVFLSKVGAGEEEEGPPISDADLTVEVFFGSEASGPSTGPLPLEEAFGEPGHFKTELIPTRPGTYTFRLVGTVAGEDIDEVFTSGPDTFSDVSLAADIEFPEKDPTTGELADSIERISARSDDGGDSTSLWIAIAGGVIALIALGLAVRKRPSA